MNASVSACDSWQTVPTPCLHVQLVALPESYCAKCLRFHCQPYARLFMFYCSFSWKTPISPTYADIGENVYNAVQGLYLVLHCYIGTVFLISLLLLRCMELKLVKLIRSSCWSNWKVKISSFFRKSFTHEWWGPSYTVDWVEHFLNVCWKYKV